MNTDIVDPSVAVPFGEIEVGGAFDAHGQVMIKSKYEFCAKMGSGGIVAHINCNCFCARWGTPEYMSDSSDVIPLKGLGFRRARS